MPLPLNQKTKRGARAPSAAASAAAAYAVPFVLNIAASGGRPTRIAAPVMLMLRRNRRLLSGMNVSPCLTPSRVALHSLEELRRPHERHEQLPELEPRLAERRIRRLDCLAIGRRLDAAQRVAERLLDDALLARAALGEQPSDLFRIRERAACQAGDLARAVDRQLHFLPRRVAPRALELDHFLVAPPSDRVVVLQAEADRIHQPMAARAGRVRDV